MAQAVVIVKFSTDLYSTLNISKSLRIQPEFPICDSQIIICASLTVSITEDIDKV